MQNGKLEIVNCKNYGSVLQDDSITNGGICGYGLGELESTNGSYNTIIIKDSWTKYGNIIAGFALYNDTSSDAFSKNNNNVYTKLIIDKTYSRQKVPVVASFSDYNNSATATYIKESGKKVNLISHPTYISHRYDS